MQINMSFIMRLENRKMIELLSTCDNCHKKYDLKIGRDPLWKYQCCSQNCVQTYFINKEGGFIPHGYKEIFQREFKGRKV